jgi:hypothetical protein
MTPLPQKTAAASQSPSSAQDAHLRIPEEVARESGMMSPTNPI